MSTRKFLLLLGAALPLATASVSVSHAQSLRGELNSAAAQDGNFDRDRNIGVRQRKRQGYEPIGVRVGAFTALGKLSLGVGHNDNIFATPTDEEKDTFVRIAPDLSLNSGWSRHQLSAYVRGAINRYGDNKAENNDDWRFGATGRLDLQRGFILNAAAETADLTESRTTSVTPTASAEPVKYSLNQVHLGGFREFNRLKITGRVDVLDYNYDDARDALNNPIEEDDRDRVVTQVTGRADYALSPATAIFVQVTSNNRDYDLETSGTLPSRDSDGVEVLTGVNFELTALMRGEIGVGYLKQSYDQVGLDDFSGFGARSQVEWFPTQLTTVTLRASRTLEDSTISGNTSDLATRVSARVDHELLRNVILGAQIGHSKDKNQGLSPREDKRWTGTLDATYLINRRVGLTVGYNYIDQDSTAAAANFTVNEIVASVNLAF
jgi:hypothetical protein